MNSIPIYQRDPYLKIYKTKVLSCIHKKNPPIMKEEGGGGSVFKNRVKNCKYVLVLEETIFQPNGGGQPSDSGTINGFACEQVEKEGQEIQHWTESAMEEGVEVTLEIDWSKRWQHMQSHTSQHLLSAVCHELWKGDTLSWELGSEQTLVELDNQNQSGVMLDQIEASCNHYIRNAPKIETIIAASSQTQEIVTKPIFRGEIPNVKEMEELRLVHIVNVDINACGGTHVKSLAELQCIKLVKIDNAKVLNLTFIAGQGLIDKLSGCLQREHELSRAMTCSSEEIVPLLTKRINEAKQVEKQNKTLMNELAETIGREYGHLPTDLQMISRSYNEGIGFLQKIASIALGLNKDSILFLTSENISDKSAAGLGQFLIAGPMDAVNKLVEGTSLQFLDVIQAKGGGNKGKYQGKANNIKNKNKAFDILHDFYKANLGGQDNSKSNENIKFNNVKTSNSKTNTNKEIILDDQQFPLQEENRQAILNFQQLRRLRIN